MSDYPVNIDEIMHKAYLQYSLSVNVGRAIPDVRDGLKPVARRILYAMSQLGLTHNHAFSKCAMVVGEVMGKYHPHGDSAIYDTLVRMAQDFSLRYPLIWGQGNFGSIDGDPPAAYRYTECRLQRLAEELLRDLNKNTVDMVPNYDEKLQEPSVLPAAFPNLLVNGTTGIGVGMATNIPPHNLTEVIDACVHLIENPNASAIELMQFIKGPDLPTGGIIMGVNALRRIYETGRGTFVVRGRCTIEETKSGSSQIVVTEIPYMVNKEQLITKIADLVNQKVIEGITNIRDLSSSRVGIRVVIDIKRGAEPQVVLNQLYAHTQLQSTLNVQCLVVDRNRPRTMTLPQLIQAYLDHRFEVITRRTRYDLEKAEARAHILEGLIIAVDNIDEVIAIIRGSRTREEAHQGLVDRFELSRIQANAILDMRLNQLTGLAIEELQAEYDAVCKEIQYLRGLLNDRQALWGVVRDELIQIREQYGDERRTEIVPIETDIAISDLIADEVQMITLSAKGYIKRMSLEEVHAQRRGGRGVKGMNTLEDDWVKEVFTASTHDYLLFFTDKGRMFWLHVYDLPSESRTARGKAIVNLIGLQNDEKVCNFLAVREIDVEGVYLLFATRKGIINRIALNAFKSMRRNGLNAIELREGDELIAVKLCESSDHVTLFSRYGMVCRFSVDKVSEHGRRTMGVRGMKLRDEGDSVVSMVVVKHPETEVLLVTAQGRGKRLAIGSGEILEDGKTDGIRPTNRGCGGVRATKLREGDFVTAVMQVEEEDHILAITKSGIMIRFPVKGVRVMGRATYGVRIMNVGEDDELVSIARIENDEDEDETEDVEFEVDGDDNGDEDDDDAIDIDDESDTGDDDDMDDESDTGDDEG
ncbi:MAG: DNA gyrase subunit A [Lentisphaerae bacterium]|nr:MAG: DNA gyrase subunit A [Lentisphaerota bacterium]